MGGGHWRTMEAGEGRGQEGRGHWQTANVGLGRIRAAGRGYRRAEDSGPRAPAFVFPCCLTRDAAWSRASCSRSHTVPTNALYPQTVSQTESFCKLLLVRKGVLSGFKVAEKANAEKADVIITGNIKEKPHAVHWNNKKDRRGRIPSIKASNL